MNKSVTPARSAKLSAIFLSVSAAILAFVRPATTYETSIFGSTIFLFWVCIATSLIFIILAIFNSHRRNQLLAGGALAVIFYSVLFSVPAARGYHLYGRGNSDILTHIGYAKALGETLSWYPAIHLQMRSLHELGLSWDLVATALAVVFSFLFAFGVALYARLLLSDKQAWTVTLAASIIPVLGPFTRSNHPSIYSFMLLPICLWLARVSKQTSEQRYHFGALVVVVAIIIYHPVTAVLLIITLLIDDIQFRQTETSSNFTILGIASIIAFSWYLSFERLSIILGAVTAPDLGGAAASQTAAALDPTLSAIDVASRFVELYGTIVIIGLLGGLATMIIILENLWEDGEPVDGTFIGHYLTSGIIGVLFLLIDLVVTAPLRVARYGAFASLLTLPNITRRYSGYSRKVISTVVIILLVTAAVLSIGTVYNTNSHFTDTEYEGATWQASYNSESRVIYAHEMGNKVDNYLFGAHTDRSVFAAQPMLEGLGYDNQDTIRESVNNAYIVTKNYDLRFVDVYSPEKRLSRQVYTKEDVERLARDPTADSVYTNGGYSVWTV